MKEFKWKTPFGEVIQVREFGFFIDSAILRVKLDGDLTSLEPNPLIVVGVHSINIDGHNYEFQDIDKYFGKIVKTSVNEYYIQEFRINNYCTSRQLLEQQEG